MALFERIQKVLFGLAITIEYLSIIASNALLLGVCYIRSQTELPSISFVLAIHLSWATARSYCALRGENYRHGMTVKPLESLRNLQD